jgi:hypothetical protein
MPERNALHVVAVMLGVVTVVAVIGLGVLIYRFIANY